ncbi:WAS/WASL-interacting protein family member 3-like [Leopardus geoffroyi]|uniref:WAS/WASL-interacting protein family member 3-like n=1 Tax=Leopardus geoffroyi TaxID=46844 RepID=UPI001E265AF7|nr:WAS/WASL-interacting protein family member 3-like [Leopardus geoffroyi]
MASLEASGRAQCPCTDRAPAPRGASTSPASFPRPPWLPAPPPPRVPAPPVTVVAVAVPGTVSEGGACALLTASLVDLLRGSAVRVKTRGEGGPLPCRRLAACSHGTPPPLCAASDPAGERGFEVTTPLEGDAWSGPCCREAFLERPPQSKGAPPSFRPPPPRRPRRRDTSRKDLIRTLTGFLPGSCPQTPPVVFAKCISRKRLGPHGFRMARPDPSRAAGRITGPVVSSERPPLCRPGDPDGTRGPREMLSAGPGPPALVHSEADQTSLRNFRQEGGWKGAPETPELGSRREEGQWRGWDAGRHGEPGTAQAASVQDPCPPTKGPRFVDLRVSPAGAPPGPGDTLRAEVGTRAWEDGHSNVIIRQNADSSELIIWNKVHMPSAVASPSGVASRPLVPVATGS